MNGIVVFRKMDGTIDPMKSKELVSQRQVTVMFFLFYVEYEVESMTWKDNDNH